MIIKSLYNYFLENQNEKDEEGNRVFPVFGYSSERVAFKLCLNGNGKFESLDIVPKILFLPDNASLDIIRSSNPVASHFFGNEKYLFGSSFKKGAPLLDYPKQIDTFLELHQKIQDEVHSKSLEATLKFMRSIREPGSCLSLIEDVYRSTKERGSVIISVEGCLLHEEKDLKRYWEDKVKNYKNVLGICSVTGKKQNLKRLHGKIKGIGGAAGGCTLVSYNMPAHESYPKSNDYPLAFIGSMVAFAYCTVLNYFLSRVSDMNHSRLGKDFLVFWTHRHKDNLFCRIFKRFFGGKEEEDNTPTELKSAVESLLQGKVPSLIPEDSNFSLAILSPNNGRVYVREFIEQPLRVIAGNVAQHCSDMKLLDPTGVEYKIPSLYALSYAASNQSTNEPSGNVCESLIRAVIKGEPYSPSLVALIIEYVLKPFSKGDSYRRPLRCMFLKANLNRKYRKENRKEISVALDKSRDNIGYLLGRLLAISDRIQAASIGRFPNKTFEDRYRSSLARTPLMVFNDLTEKVADHLAKLRRTKRGLCVVLGKEYNEVFSKLRSIPEKLDQDEQAEFAIGFQHQFSDQFNNQ